MSIILLSADLLVNQIDWTRERYERLIAVGIISEDDRVEFLQGKIIAKDEPLLGARPDELHYYQVNWTVAQYQRMIAEGILEEDERLELLFGKIIHMSPVGKLHAACVSRLAKYFIQGHADRFSCRQEQPIVLNDDTQPQPDYVLARYREDDYAAAHPGPDDILLLIEVADQTLLRDRGPKLLAYAAAGIAEYWILNLIDRHLEIYTQPTDSGNYAIQRVIREKEAFEHPRLGKIEPSALFPYG